MQFIKNSLACLVALTLFTTAFASAHTRTITDKPICHSIEKDMESTQICTYKNGNLNQVYQQYRNALAKSEQPYLLAQMPLTAKKVDINAETQIIYKPNKSGLFIEQSFAGGVTTIAFKKLQKNLIQVMTVGSPD